MSGTRGGFPGEKRTDRLIHEHIHDPYRNRKKLKEPACCSQCAAILENGRWHWGDRPEGANEELCPACRRINDRCPAGKLNLSGDFLKEHRDEVIGLAQREERKEKGEHPLHRIINIEEGNTRVEITTTDIHLPRRIGGALHKAYGGDLDFHYKEETYFIRVNWKR
ncbi:MAG: ATPase [Proteobacteria bacterium]|nr:ATPase [Pseudomonadota bacterium]